AQERPVGTVEEIGEVVLIGDVRGGGHQDLVDRVTLDVHAEDAFGVRSCLVGALSELDPARLASAPDLDLGLYHHTRTKSLGDRGGLIRSGSDVAVQHRQPVPGEERTPLVLVQVHNYLFW